MAILLLAGGGVAFAVVNHNSQHKPPTAAPSSPPTESPAALYAQDRTGVVKILTTTCDSLGEGTGFELSPRLVATVAHVVDGETSIKIKSGSASYTGQVVGQDDESDVALIRTNQPLSGHVFHLASTVPAVGSQLAVIGYPLDGPITLTVGSVSGTNRQETINGFARAGLIQTDAAVNPGNSGGPVIDDHGLVDGLVDAKVTNAEGLGYAVSTNDVGPLLNSWVQAPVALPPAECQQTTQAAPPPAPPAPQLTGPLGTVTAFFNAINAKNWPLVWSLGGDNLGGSYQQMVTGYAETAHDNPFIYHVGGTTVDVALLAKETSGATQTYVGRYTVENGAITAGHLTLEGTDSGSGFRNLAGTWYGHDRTMVITPGGSGIIAYRTFNWCKDDPVPDCDGLVGIDIINGGLTTFRLSSYNGNGGNGQFGFSTTGLTGSLSITRDAANNTLNIPQFGQAPFCSPTSQQTGVCGA
jgi:S1-C subfamily serine protease